MVQRAHMGALERDDPECAARRAGGEDTEVAVELELASQPEQAALSGSLALMLGVPNASRASVLEALWTHIRTHHLQVSLLKET